MGPHEFNGGRRQWQRKMYTGGEKEEKGEEEEKERKEEKEEEERKEEKEGRGRREGKAPASRAAESRDAPLIPSSRCTVSAIFASG